jgi:hypothetical protein
MRLPEKALELNFCAQFSELVSPRQTLWFGLTQRQEAQWGFDASANIGGQLTIFQFKAPKRINEGLWRLGAKHQQLLKLQGLSQNHSSEVVSIFYAFPLISDDVELQSRPQLLPKTWLLDVHQLPAIPSPPRKDGTHNVEVRLEEGKEPIAHVRTIHADFQLRSAQDFVHELRGSYAQRNVVGFPEDDLSTKGEEVAIQMPLGLKETVGVLLWPLA